MDWLIPAIVATLTATLILALVYAFLYFQERRLALGLWTLAWIFSCFRYVVELGLHDRRNGASYILGVQLFSLLTGVFLLWGCFAWVQRRLPVAWLLVTGLCGAWIIGGVVAQVNPLWITYPTFFFTGAVFLINGILFLRLRDRVGVGRWIVGVAFILWGLHKFDYPWLRELAWFASWGYLFSSSLSVTVAVGLLLAHFERDRRILRLSQSQVQGLLDATQETLMMIDRDGIVLACNNTVARRLGKPAAELIGQNLYTILPEPVASSRRQKVESIFRTGRAIDFEDERAGYLYWNYMSPVLDPNGSVRAVSIFAEDITQRRRAETERNRLFTYSVDLLCIAGFDGFFRELNPAWMQSLGWSETELKSRPWLDFVHPDDQTATVEAGKRLVEGQTVLDFDNRYRCKDGSWRWLSWNSFPLLDQGEIFAVARDVTEQKSAEQILQDRETMLNSIYRAAPVGIGIFRNRVFCQVNGRFCEMIGYSREEMIGQSARMLYPSQDEFDRVGRDHYDQVRRYGIGSIETRWKRKDGTNLDILLSSAPLDSQDLSLGVVVTATDITDRKKAEAAIVESESKFRAIASYTPDHILMQDLDLRYTFVVNPQLGLTEADMIGKTDRDFLPPEVAEKLIAAKRKVLQTGQPLPFAVSVKNRKAEIEHFEGSYIPKFGADGRVDGLIGYFQNVTERKRSVEALRESENFLRESQIIAGLGSYVLDIPNGLWKSSAVLDQVFGIDQAYQRSVEGWVALIHPDDRQQMSDYFANEVLGKGVRFDREYRIIRHDSQVERWVHGLGNLEFDAQRRPLKMFGTIQDITERKRAEEEVQKLASVVRHSKELVNLAMRDGRMIFLNEAGRILLGIDPDDVPKTYILEVIPDHLKEKACNELLAALMRGDTWEGDLQYRNLKTGNLTDVHTIAFPVIDPNKGQILFFANVSQDITERKQAEKTLKESEQRFRRIVEASPMGMHLFELRNDGELVLIDANPAADRHTGIHTADRIGKTIEQAFPGLVGTEVPARYKQIAAGGQAWQTTNLFYQDNAIHGAFDIVAFQTVPGRMATMFLEVSDRIRAEQQREQLLKALQAKTEELESIIYVSSHDLRSPLVNIQGFSGELGESCRQIRELLSGDAVPESDHQQLEELLGRDIPSALEYITTSVSKLDALQKGLLKICRIGRESLEIVPVAMNELIDGVIKSTRYQLDNCRAQVIVEPLPICLADAGQLTQVFTNLIDNAIKYRSPDRSLVIRIHGRAEGAHAVYTVADNGVGIAPEHQPKVFEMFHQLDPLNGPGGEGLGLTIVKRILGRMDGQVRLESAFGVGSAFFVLLPKA